jgi:hypothetical protein
MIDSHSRLDLAMQQLRKLNSCANLTSANNKKRGCPLGGFCGALSGSFLNGAKQFNIQGKKTIRFLRFPNLVATRTIQMPEQK